MAQDNRGNVGSTVAAFLIGGLVGAGVALLLAPRSGRETRERLMELASRANATVSSAVEKGRGVTSREKATLAGDGAGDETVIEEREVA